MPTWYRVVELDDGQWACRRGLEVFDHHDDKWTAIEHVTGLAQADPPSKVYLHPIAASVQTVATYGE